MDAANLRDWRNRGNPHRSHLIGIGLIADGQRQAERLKDTQDMLQPDSGFAGLQLDDKTHPHFGGEGQLRLGQAQRPSCLAHDLTQMQ